MKKLHIFEHQTSIQHDTGPYHPETSKRVEVIHNALCGELGQQSISFFSPKSYNETYVNKTHDQSYIKQLKKENLKPKPVYLDSDTLLNTYSLEAAYYGVASNLLAADHLMQKKCSKAFCNIRPPGHHAEYDKAMGFCLFNNAVIAAHYFLDHYNLERAAILDFDVHHGNGTEDIIRDNPNILFCSTFQYPFYPGTVFSENKKNIINSPLPAGLTGNDYRKEIISEWLPAIEDFKPNIIIVSAGFDAHKLDPLADFNLIEEDYYWLGKTIAEQADRYCDGKVLSTLEGGYNLDILGQSVVAFCKGLIQ